MEKNAELIKRMFLEQARIVWGDNELLNQIEVTVSFNNRKVKTMALANSGRGKAIGKSLYRVDRNQTLYVSDVALAYDDSRFIRTLRHEAIHLGYMRHTDDFFSIARETGAVLTGAQEKGFGYQVQIQISKGGRFTTIKKFDNEPEAIRYANEYAENLHSSGKSFHGLRVKI